MSKNQRQPKKGSKRKAAVDDQTCEQVAEEASSPECSPAKKKQKSSRHSSRSITRGALKSYQEEDDEEDDCEKSSRWDVNFLLLLQFRAREGHLRVPSFHVEDGQPLGRWIGKHRTQKRTGTLGSEKEHRLNEIGFIWNTLDEFWEKMFRALRQFKQREGHLRVPTKHVEDGLQLGCWNGRQKEMKKSGTLVPERERRLNEIGYIWNALDGKWDTMFRALTKFKQREGHLRVPTIHVEDGYELGVWIKRRRRHKKAGTLCSEEERRLNEIGFIWNASEGNWDFMFTALTQFKLREGHLRVPIKHVEDGNKLGKWVSVQRDFKQDGTLGTEKERRLNEIGFIWNALEGQYDAMCNALAQFKERDGHCDVFKNHIEYMDCGAELKLGTWLKNQRAHHGYGTLDATRVKRLESLGVAWESNQRDITEEHFDQNFDLLLVFKEREGHVEVPGKHKESANDDLGMWLATQRSLHRDGLLELDRQKWLEVAGVAWKSRISSKRP